MKDFERDEGWNLEGSGKKKKLLALTSPVTLIFN